MDVVELEKNLKLCSKEKLIDMIIIQWLGIAKIQQQMQASKDK